MLPHAGHAVDVSVRLQAMHMLTQSTSLSASWIGLAAGLGCVDSARLMSTANKAKLQGLISKQLAGIQAFTCRKHPRCTLYT